MSVTSLGKGKGKALLDEAHTEFEQKLEEETSLASGSSSDSDSDSDSDTSDESSSDEDDISQDVLDALLEKARRNCAGPSRTQAVQDGLGGEEDEIHLGDDDEQPLPLLNPGSLPTPYIELGDSKKGVPSKLHDLEVERAERASGSSAPKAPAPPPSAGPSGKTLTKKERKALRTKTAGKSWYDLPAPEESDLPRLYREVEAMRLRNQLDPKRFYRKEEGEGKGIKGLPKYFAIGTIVAEKTPFGGQTSDNLVRGQRKRTLVDELVDDAEAKSYAKKKFKELQTVRGARGRGTLARKQAARKPKW